MVGHCFSILGVCRGTLRGNHMGRRIRRNSTGSATAVVTTDPLDRLSDRGLRPGAPEEAWVVWLSPEQPQGETPPLAAGCG